MIQVRERERERKKERMRKKQFCVLLTKDSKLISEKKQKKKINRKGKKYRVLFRLTREKSNFCALLMKDSNSVFIAKKKCKKNKKDGTILYLSCFNVSTKE